MSGRKPHPERVNPEIGARVLRQAKDRQSSYIDYIVLHFRATGNLAPGCDARDWFAWWKAGKRKPDAATR